MQAYLLCVYDFWRVLVVRDLRTFEHFVMMCAARTGQLINLAALAADCGINAVTAKQWLSVLDTSYVIRLLQPWHENFGKRLVRMLKLYFVDTGFLCHRLRIPDALSLGTHAMRGPVFESWVITETLKYRFNRGLAADLYFWRDNHGVEVDLVFPHQGRLHPIEIKSGRTFSEDWLNAGEKFKTYAKAHSAPLGVVYGGDANFDFQATAVSSWRMLMQASAKA